MSGKRPKKINKISIWVQKSVWTLIISVFFLSLLSFTTSAYLIYSTKKNAKIINISSQQQVLAQKLIYLSEILLLNQGKEGYEQVKNQALEARDLMQSHHHDLIYGNEKESIPALEVPTIRALYFEAPYQTDQRVKEFFKFIDSVINKEFQGSKRDTSLFHNDYNDLFEGLGQVVHGFQKESENQAMRLILIVFIFFLLTAIILCISIFFILKPLTSKLNLEQKKLKDREIELERTSQVVEQSANAVIITDLEGYIQYVNRGFETISGFSKDEVSGKKPSIWKGTPIGPEHYAGLWSTLSAGKSWKGEFCNLKKDGSTYWQRAFITPIRDLDGRIIEYASIQVDITDKKAIQNNLENLNKELSSILETADEGFWELDHDGFITKINPHMLSILKKNMGEVINHHPEEFLNDNSKELIAVEKKLLQKGLKSRCTVEILRSDNSTLTCLLSSVPINQDPNDCSCFTLITDISEQKKVEEELREREEMLDKIFNNSPIPMILAEYPNMNYIKINQAVVDFHQVDKERILSSKLSDLIVNSRDVKKIETLIRRGKKVSEYEMQIKSLGTKQDRWCSHAIDYIVNKNQLLLVICFMDTTLKKETNDVLREAKNQADLANQAKSDFLANMSHEVRTPMNGIMGMTQLCLQTNLSPKQKDYLNKISKSCNSLLDIVNDILDFSKIEAQKLQLETREFDPEQVFESISTLLGQKASDKGLELHFDLAPDIPHFLKGDQLRLSQILLNLTNNAIKFTEKGEVLVGVQQVKEIENRVRLRFFVKDSGIGLTEEQKNRLFNPFTQADGSTTRKYGGTGLGLAISQKLVEMMRGKIEIDSAPGEGSTFYFTAEFFKSNKKKKKVYVFPSHLKNLKVLVVDDNPTSLHLMKKILHSFDFTANILTSPNEAIKELETPTGGKPYDLLLTDWQMEELDGLKLVKAVHENNKIEKKPNTILVTAHLHKYDLMKNRSALIGGVISKPIQKSNLFNKILEVSNTHPAPATLEANLSLEIYDHTEIRKISGARILLTEDNEINQQVAKELLENAGLHVTLAMNGQEAIDAVKRENFEAVLMDLQMPVKDGFEATRTIREDKRFNDLPIIAMTANAMKEDRERCLEIGMQDHTSKPIVIDQLFSTLLKWIQPENIVTPQKHTVHKSIYTDDLELLELPNIDSRNALKKLGGQSSLYRKILIKFYQMYFDLIAEIAIELEEEKYTQVARKAHSIKGLAGNIGASSLQNTATRFEKVLSGANEQQIAAEFIKFEQELIPVLYSIKPLVEEANKSGNIRVTVHETIDQKTLLSILEEMEEALILQKPILCKEVFRKLCQHSFPPDLAESPGELEKLILEYNFDAAHTTVKKMEKILTCK